MNKSRPKNLNLFTIRFPVTAIASILHRVSGLGLFLLIPCLLWLLSYSLTESGFDQLERCLFSAWGKLLVWIIFIPFCYHFAAGIRHLVMDLHIGTTREGGKVGAKVMFGVSIALILLVGIWLW